MHNSIRIAGICISIIVLIIGYIISIIMDVHKNNILNLLPKLAFVSGIAIFIMVLFHVISLLFPV